MNDGTLNKLGYLEDIASYAIPTEAEGWINLFGAFKESGLEGALLTFLKQGIVSGKGNYFRLYGTLNKAGLMLCWQNMNLTYNSGSTLRGTWDFPVAFDSAPQVFAFLSNGLGSATPTLQMISTLSASSRNAASVDISLTRASGQTNFATNDTAAVDVFAIGSKFSLT